MEILNEILQFLHFNPDSTRAKIEEKLNLRISTSTIKRILSEAIAKDLIIANGKSRATSYRISPQAKILLNIDLDSYFLKEIDERNIQTSFNFDLITKEITSIKLFNEEEFTILSNLQQTFTHNIESISIDNYNSEMERLGIDLSWKSAQIEGNTYSLLETERLLKEKEEAKGKTKDEAIMLLNHKDALHFILKEPDYLKSLSVRHIEDIHSLLIKDLNIERNIRSRRVGITGTNYRPLENEFQIKEALQDTCDLINSKNNIFEKALLALVLISYIQPFSDGNKRTARIISNAILLANKHCPISFRTVDSIDYKKAMLLFYEQNNISAFKKIFIDQYKFAVNTYF